MDASQQPDVVAAELQQLKHLRDVGLRPIAKRFAACPGRAIGADKVVPESDSILHDVKRHPGRKTGVVLDLARRLGIDEDACVRRLSVEVGARLVHEVERAVTEPRGVEVEDAANAPAIAGHGHVVEFVVAVHERVRSLPPAFVRRGRSRRSNPCQRES